MTGIESYLNANNILEGTCCGILQCPIPGLLLFNVSSNDTLMFFKACGICNYVDDKTSYMLETNFYQVQDLVKTEFERLENRLFGHYMNFNSHEYKFVSFAD